MPGKPWPIRASPAGTGDVLRYAYVPPSLRALRQRRQTDRLRLLLRAVLMSLVVFGATGDVFAADHPLVWASSQLPAAGLPSASVTATPVLPLYSAEAALTVQTSADISTTATIPAPTQEAAAGSETTGSAATPIGVASSRSATVLATLARSQLQSPASTVATAGTRRLTAPTVARAPTPRPVPPLDTASLMAELTRITRDAKGTYGIFVIDLTSGQEVNLRGTAAMPAASVNKLEILAALYHEVELSRLSLNSTVRTKGEDLQNYGTGVIRYQPVGTSYTLDELARLLIEQSDNTASYLLARMIGLGNVNALDTGWGLRSTEVGEAVSSPRDAALLLALLYHGRLVNAAHSREMLNFLEHTAWNDRIPAGVPEGVAVAHKIGNQINVVNDAGIVYLPGRPYVLSIFSQDVDEDQAVTIEQDVSRAVYHYELQAKGGS